ncbi:MAG: HAMP domain-containing sensor histidine kinase [Firmicutes bacterium]|nr:HAMP domain-containing sensor histidine kinase [Bacillota bacterium]
MKSTFSRSFCITAAILLIAMIILGASFQLQVNQYLTNQTVSDLQQNADAIANLAAAYSSNGGLSNRDFQLNLIIASQVSGADAVVCDGDGNVVLCSDAPSGCEHQGLQLNREYLQKVISNGGDTATGIIKGLYTDRRYVVSEPILSGEEVSGIVLVSTPTIATTQIMNRISNIFLTAALFVVLISVLAVTAFARRESKPLKDMAKTATAFGHGDLEARVKLEDDYSEEMEELAVAFNNMAISLQKSEYQRQEFVANVSHELKTPMTTISGYIDGILDGTIPPEKQAHYLRIVSDETKRLSRLVRSMLDISQLQKEEGIPEEKKMHFDLEDCAGQVLITFEKKINDKHINVNVDMPEHPVYTMANPDYITQVIYNLIDNAVKFCPEGGNLGLTIKEGGSKAYVSISNDGETIPPEELPLVFDRFHKLDKSRSQNRDGWGLGLYIVKTIVCSHGEDISVSSKDGKTEFTFTMPLVN